MQEMWICSECRSVNTQHVSRCYSCRAARPAQSEVFKAAPAVRPVLTPGLDDEHFRVAWMIKTQHGYVSAWRLGYVAAALLAVWALTLVVDGAFNLGSFARTLLDPNATPSAGLVTLRFLVQISVFVIGAAAVICHSVFLGLADHDVLALGGGTPRFGAVRAGLWWIESWLWSALAALICSIPGLVLIVGGLWLAYSVLSIAFGIVGFIIFAWLFWQLAQARIEPWTWLAKPRLLLQDLFDRLALPEDPGSRVVTFFTGAWVAAFGLPVLVILATWVLMIAMFVLAFTASDPFGAIDSALNTFVTFASILYVYADLAFIVVLVLLVRITVSVSHRLRVREAWFAASENLARAELVQAGVAPGFETVDPATLAAAIAAPLASAVAATPGMAAENAAPPPPAGIRGSAGTRARGIGSRGPVAPFGPVPAPLPPDAIPPPPAAQYPPGPEVPPLTEQAAAVETEAGSEERRAVEDVPAASGQPPASPAPAEVPGIPAQAALPPFPPFERPIAPPPPPLGRVTPVPHTSPAAALRAHGAKRPQRRQEAADGGAAPDRESPTDADRDPH